MRSNFKYSTILVAEDDPLSLEYLSLILQEHFLNVVSATNGSDAFEKFSTNNIDIVLTDIRMPIQNGIDFVGHIRSVNNLIPIIYMSAYAEVDILLQTMKHSANGFLVKPLKLNELFECLSDGLNKASQLKLVHDVSCLKNEFKLAGGALINLKQQTVFLNNKEVFLTKKEIQLLELLLRNNNAIMSKEIIEDYIWYGMDISSGSVKALVNKLRDKIGKNTISTIKNIGYKINLIENDMSC